MGRADMANKLLGIWNTEKLPKWTAHKALTARARKQLNAFIDYFGLSESERAFRLALSYAKRQQWAIKANLSLANLASNDKLIDYAEKEMQDYPYAHHKTKSLVVGDIAEHHAYGRVVIQALYERGSSKFADVMDSEGLHRTYISVGMLEKVVS